MDMHDAEASRPFQITTWQLANAFHDYWVCPLRHNASRPRERCPRLVRLVVDTRSLLERATAQPLVPRLSTQAPVDARSERLPPGWTQDELFRLPGLREA